MKLYVITSSDGYPIWIELFKKPAQRFVEFNPDFKLLVFKREKRSSFFSLLRLK